MTDLDARPRLRIDPRFRQRRIEVKREEGRKRLKTLVFLGALLGAVSAVLIVLHSPLLAVRHLRVTGASRTPVAAIEAAAGLHTGRSMVDVHAAAEARAIARLPWINTVTVTRRWPSTVTVAVTERVPVAVIGVGGTPAMVDASGRILGPPSLTLPVVITDGDPSLGGLPGPATTITPVVAAAPGAAGTDVDPVYRPGLQVAAALTPSLVPRLTKIVVLGDGTVRLGLSGGGSALLGPPDALGEKLLAVETLLDQTVVGRGTIDVTVPSAPVVVGTGA